MAMIFRMLRPAYKAGKACLDWTLCRDISRNEVFVREMALEGPEARSPEWPLPGRLYYMSLRALRYFGMAVTGYGLHMLEKQGMDPMLAIGPAALLIEKGISAYDTVLRKMQQRRTGRGAEAGDIPRIPDSYEDQIDAVLEDYAWRKRYEEHAGEKAEKGPEREDPFGLGYPTDLEEELYGSDFWDRKEEGEE